SHGICYIEVFHVLGVAGNLLAGQPNHSDTDALSVIDRSRLDFIDRGCRVCGKKQKIRLTAARTQRRNTEIEFAAFDGNGVIADGIHDSHYRLPLESVRDKGA